MVGEYNLLKACCCRSPKNESVDQRRDAAGAMYVRSLSCASVGLCDLIINIVIGTTPLMQDTRRSRLSMLPPSVHRACLTLSGRIVSPCRKRISAPTARLPGLCAIYSGRQLCPTDANRCEERPLQRDSKGSNDLTSSFLKQSGFFSSALTRLSCHFNSPKIVYRHHPTTSA